LIKRICLSAKDEATLKKLLAQRRYIENAQPKDYRDRVVLKPWGHEYLILQNEHVAVWFLHIKSGHSTSMHCHPQKKTCLIVLSGSALCNTFHHRNYIDGVSAVMIEKGVFHSTHAMSPDGIDLIEIETPPNKTDLVRFNDGYGREQHGYESESEMQTERLERFNYFYIDESAILNRHYGNSTYNIAAETYAENEIFQRSFRISDNGLYSSCRGQLLDQRGNVLLDVGEVQLGSALKERANGDLMIRGNLFLLKAWTVKNICLDTAVQNN
jgi:mannose-6-phosphate isomerase-like protein (cupin superfamily)